MFFQEGLGADFYKGFLLGRHRRLAEVYWSITKSIRLNGKIYKWVPFCFFYKTKQQSFFCLIVKNDSSANMKVNIKANAKVNIGVNIKVNIDKETRDSLNVDKISTQFIDFFNL